MATSSGRKNRRIAFSIGALITLLVAATYWAGGFDRAEWLLYDQLFSWSGPGGQTPDSGQIAHVDIDDASLAQVGRWPWPRARLAEVIDELTALDARLIVLDVLCPEPQPPRLAADPYGKHFDLLGRSQFIGQDAGEQFVHDDELLADAMRRSGRVFLSMHFVLADESGEDAAAGASPAPATQPSDGQWLLTPAGKRYVGARVAEVMAADPQADPLAVARAIWPPAVFEGGPVQDLILNACRQEQSLAVIGRRFTLPSSAAAARDWPRAAEAVAPIPDLGRQVAGIGFVSFKPDPDGTMRAIPLLVNYRDRTWPQLALQVACRLRGIELESIRARDGRLDLGPAAPAVPLDSRGCMLINWRHPTDRWQDCFVHVPIGAVLDINRNRRLIAENEQRLAIVAAEAVRLVLADDPQRRSDWELYVRSHELLANPPASLAELPAEMRRQMIAAAAQETQRLEAEAGRTLRAEFDALSAEPDPARLDDARRERLNLLRGIAEPLWQPQHVRDENARLAEAVRRQQAELRPLLAGKVCFVGSTATGAADFLPTPVFRRCPGVVVHSNILNTILTGDFIRPAPRWLNLAAILLCGLIASGATARFGPRLAGLLVFATMAAVAATNALAVFAALGAWVILAAPLAAIFLIWGFVTAYRQLTEQRQRRWVTRALGSYTSPAVARRIAEHPDLLALAGEDREITCFFSDIKGFTPISERLGSRRTVTLLNRYLDRMTDALLRHEATINKFLGDGIFAFFGAPDVQPDHPARAARAAVDCLDALAGLSGELADLGAPAMAMRIGLATGPAVVGNCGSANKFDYTAIGDTVNLASRLEAANKFFGTHILVSGPAADALGGEFVLRPLGRIIVVGKQEAVAVSELVGRADRVNPQQAEWADRFGRSVALYAGAKFAEAAAAFNELADQRPDDQAARVYLDLARRAAREGPGPAWSDAIVMTAK